MDRAVLDKIVREVSGYIESDGTKLAPREGSCSSHTYADPTWLEQERKLIRSKPVIVGHSTVLKNPGDFFTDDSTGVPIIVARQADGSLRALLNVCAHRGATVCREARGNCRSFVCPYHAWAYRLDGSPVRMPPREAFPNLTAPQASLTELPVEERHGFIWVIATPGTTIDVAAHLGALDGELASYDPAGYVLERETTLTEKINWKFVIDGFLEVYHFPSLHPKTISPYFFSKHSSYDEYGKHGRLVGVRRSFERERAALGEGAQTADIAKHFAFNYVIFPNTVLVWQGDHFECWTAFPGERADRCRVYVRSITTAATAGPAFTSRWDKNWKILIDTVIAEDWAISKTIQKSFGAVPARTLVFGRNELGLQHFHGQLKKEIGRL